MYIDNYGNITITNHSTGDTALMQMKLRGWGGKDAYIVEGWVKDKNGIVKY